MSVSSSVPPLPRFSQRDNNVGPVKLFLSTLLHSLPTGGIVASWSSALDPKDDVLKSAGEFGKSLNRDAPWWFQHCWETTERESAFNP
jgi:hypothetical protein